MADNAAQNKLGELFVDFQASGLDGMLKGLNGLSAQFLLTKNTAEQAIKPIMNIATSASNNVIALDKLSAATGLSLETLQKLEQFSKKHHLDNLIGDVSKLQNLLIQAQTIPGSAAAGILAKWGINAKEETDVLQTLIKIQQAAKNIGNAPVATQFLSELGLSSELLYSEDIKNTLDEVAGLGGENLENLREIGDLGAEINKNIQILAAQLVSGMPFIKDILKDINLGLNFLTGQKNTVETSNKDVEWARNKVNKGFTLDVYGYNRALNILKNYNPIKPLTEEEMDILRRKGDKKRGLDKPVNINDNILPPLPKVSATSSSNITINNTNNVTVKSTQEANDFFQELTDTQAQQMIRGTN